MYTTLRGSFKNGKFHFDDDGKKGCFQVKIKKTKQIKFRQMQKAIKYIRVNLKKNLEDRGSEVI